MTSPRASVTVTLTDAQARVVAAALNLYTTHTPDDDVGITATDLLVAERAWTRINHAIANRSQ